ncbi:uncharacterized protein LOC105177840 [Sesamum indicum]|uniref:Uncharacterized protein LOC105177840 n=1 Tax=Sesamum indicum TaxID=4182 RepID=A0A6I9UDY8_SESIN|nr:uncharacterized protein LOC105177840 [Sesamum indicum]
MSWLARSIANSLKFDDDDDNDLNPGQKPDPKESENPESQSDDGSLSPTSPSRGVKEDLSELSRTLTRQFWGVASFLAPPPQPEQKSDPDVSEPDQGSILGIRSDFAEIGGKFRSGISRLSNNINVSEITKIASNFLQLESDEENEETGRKVDFTSLGKGAVGVTEEVVAFARDIAMHPETWLDFPLPQNAGDDVDFDMSDAQQEHALAVERFAPRLAALRIELCPEYMSESCFWKIYFVLVHPRLVEEDAELLSTPQIVEARALLAHELKNQNTARPEDLSEKRSLDPEENAISRPEEHLSVPSPVIPKSEHDKASDVNISTSAAISTPEVVKHSVERNEVQIVDKPVIEENDAGQVKDPHSISGPSNVYEKKDEDDADDWLKEETSEIGGAVGNIIPVENEDDVSFSDLEEDDGDIPTSFRKSNYSSDKDSRDWVQLGKSPSDNSKNIDVKHSDKENANDNETEGSNDWLDVDDIVVA